MIGNDSLTVRPQGCSSTRNGTDNGEHEEDEEGEEEKEDEERCSGISLSNSGNNSGNMISCSCHPASSIPFFRQPLSP